MDAVEQAVPRRLPAGSRERDLIQATDNGAAFTSALPGEPLGWKRIGRASGAQESAQVLLFFILRLLCLTSASDNSFFCPDYGKGKGQHVRLGFYSFKLTNHPFCHEKWFSAAFGGYTCPQIFWAKWRACWIPGRFAAQLPFHSCRFIPDGCGWR